MGRIALFLHVGTRKSGTTYLQRTLHHSADALREQGVRLLNDPSNDATEALLRRPLKQAVADGDLPAARAAVATLARRIEDDPAPTQVLSYEMLAELPPAAIEPLLDGLAAYDVHVVVTARSWGLTIPSEWQQHVKERGTTPFPDYVAAIRDRTPEARAFLDRHDLPAMVERWGRTLPPDRVHVVACPPPDRPEGTLVDLFCALVGCDPTTLTRPSTPSNESLSDAQAEMLRRLNVTLGRRLRRSSGEYVPAVRRWITNASLMRSERRRRIELPPELGPWCADVTRAQVQGVRASGVDVVGRTDDLLFEAERATGRTVVPDAEVADVAITTIADLAERRFREQRRHARRIARLEARLAAVRKRRGRAGPLTRARRRTRRVVRSLRDRRGPRPAG